jgi:hypothetical protein
MAISSAVRPGWREKVYKYMRIYLWTALRIMDLRVRDLIGSALRNMVLRMGVLRKRGGVDGLILDSACGG